MARWSGDREIILRALPRPHFRQRDMYDVCDRLRIDRWQAQGIWLALRVEGRIVRTSIRIGRARERCYWERSHCAIRLGPHNRRVVPLLTKVTA